MMWVVLTNGKGCGLEKLQTVIDAVAIDYGTLMKDVRGGPIRCASLLHCCQCARDSST